MTSLPRGITQADLARYARLTEGVKALEDEKKVLNTKIKQAYDAAGITGKQTLVYPAAAGALIVDLNEQRSVDTDMLTADYPLEEHPTHYKSVVNPDSFAADLLESYRTKTKPTLSVKRAKA